MSDYIPQEICVEILLRQTPKSLVKCTSVCREWKSLITDRTFISDHFSRTIQANNGNGCLFLHLHHRKKEYSIRSSFLDYIEYYSYNEQIDHLAELRIPQSHLFLCKNLWVAGTCNGLLCLTDVGSVSDSANIIICNPSIRKYLLLPKPRKTFNSQSYWASFGLGFDARTNDFKVVKILTLYENQNPSHVEVYSLATGSWRSINCKASLALIRWCPWGERWTTPLFMNEKLHWIVSRRSRDPIDKYFILSFDVVEETFGELMLPKCWRLPVTILSGGDSLAVVQTRTILSRRTYFNSFSIWVMKEYGVVESWTEVLQLDSRRCGGIARILALRSGGEVVVRLFSGAIILLDPMKELVKDLGVRHVFNASVGSHAESLLLLNKKNGVFSY